MTICVNFEAKNPHQTISISLTNLKAIYLLTSVRLTRAAHTFLLIKVKHRSKRTIKFTDLIAVTAVIRCAVILRCRVEKVIRVLAIDTLGLRHIYDDR